jgi:hypothetical protein
VAWAGAGAGVVPPVPVEPDVAGVVPPVPVEPDGGGVVPPVPVEPDGPLAPWLADAEVLEVLAVFPA